MELCRTYGALECSGALSMIGLHPILSYIPLSGFYVIFSNLHYLKFIEIHVKNLTVLQITVEKDTGTYIGNRIYIY